MGKFGVGVGEEFPVDEDKSGQEGQQGSGPKGSGEPDSGSRDCPGAEEWRARHAEWHERWRSYTGGRGHWSGPQFWRVLFIIGGIALLIAIISHFLYFILGAAVLAVLYVVHSNHHHDALWDMHPRGPSSSGEAS